VKQKGLVEVQPQFQGGVRRRAKKHKKGKGGKDLYPFEKVIKVDFTGHWNRRTR